MNWIWRSRGPGQKCRFQSSVPYMISLSQLPGPVGGEGRNSLFDR